MRPRSLTERLTRALWGFSLFSAILVFALYSYKIFHKQGYSDFDVYYRAATQAAEGQWEKVYAFNRQGWDTPFRYAPPSVLLFRPFAALSHDWARLVWFWFQCLCFAGGLGFLYRGLKQTEVEARSVTCAAYLFSLRFFLDCFMIGQVTSVMFLGIAASLFFEIRQFGAKNRREKWLSRASSGAALAIPSLLKVGPALLYAATWPLTWLSGALTTVLLSLATTLACGSLGRSVDLWRDWRQVVANDSRYFDASHYGSQSVKSALLRLANEGTLTPSGAHGIWILTSMLFVGITLFVYWKRPARTALGKLQHYGLGVLTYFYVMPETFKYSLPLLVFPVAAILSGRKERLQWLSLAFALLTLSLAGLDIIGSKAFFALQKLSVPVLAQLLLGAALLQQCFWKQEISTTEP